MWFKYFAVSGLCIAGRYFAPLPLLAFAVFLGVHSRAWAAFSTVLLAAIPLFWWRPIVEKSGLKNIRRRLHQRRARQRLAGDKRPAVLFLRSFDLARLKRTVVREQRREYYEGRRFPQTYETLVDRERPLLKALNKHGPLVALGEVEQNWLGRLIDVVEVCASRADWMMIVQEASLRAGIIMVFPELSDGIADEMRYLAKSPLLGRALVYMPAVETRRRGSWKASWSWRSGAGWSRDPEAVGEFGKRWIEVQKGNGPHFSLPDYEASGLLYLPNEDFSPRFGIPFDDCSPRDFGRATKTAVWNIRGSLPPASEMAALLEALGR
jgi:hypothetical protein